ncbi:hypothetical protein COY27_03340 [Candidatus Woesearchaeota archaeon CG_4_10_14_0_2_um_filter_33_13]|nr:MAG: hypothetical protein COY27_03340 [Candidatus Woesearchaeota archaeon CG_4_10_14_0_2_um_filter_33_13]
MLNKISQEIKQMINTYSQEDQIIFNNQTININENDFSTIKETETNKTITFIDGGQAEIISTGNFCLSFIRVFAQTFKDNKKTEQKKHEFYLFTKAKWQNDDLFYESKVYGSSIINSGDLLISSNDSTIKTGSERAPINKITNMARRFAELSLANEVKSDYILLDGTLEPTFKNEEKYLQRLGTNVSSLAKSSSLFTTSGNSPIILLNKIGPQDNWSYFLKDKTYFVKLNSKAKHVFRFEGNKEILPTLVRNSQDALFLGYPYGLILTDKLARVSNSEKNSLKVKFLLKSENKEIIDYLATSNAHDILDNLG